MHMELTRNLRGFSKSLRGISEISARIPSGPSENKSKAYTQYNIVVLISVLFT
jgi:hypothetical protein